MWETQFRQNSSILLAWTFLEGRQGVSRVSQRTDGVDDLLNHHLGELKLLVLLAFSSPDILRDDRRAVALASETVAATVHPSMMIIVIVTVESTDAGALADTAVAEGSGAIMLPSEIQGLEEEQNGHAADGEKKEHHLHAGLSSIQWCFDLTRRKEHVDQHVEKSGRLLSDRQPVDAPFVDDGEDEVAEDGLEEDHAGDEVAQDVDGCLKVAGVNVG